MVRLGISGSTPESDAADQNTAAVLVLQAKNHPRRFRQWDHAG
jgi:hypothetical protein